MMKRILTVLTLATWIGCGPGVTNPMPDIPETVEYDTVRIEYGDDDLLADTPEGMSTQALIGDPSLIAAVSKGLIVGTNRIIRDQLRAVAQIVRLPPTEASDGIWLWHNLETKADDDLYSRFAIQRLEPGRFGYQWTLGQTRDGMLPVFAGEFSPRDRVGGAQRGSGILTFNFDNAHEVDPDTDAPRGRAAIAFRSVGGVRQVRVATFGLITQGETEARDALLEFVQLPSRAGRLKFSQPVDFLKDGEPVEQLSIDAVWTPRQEGRALASLSGGSLEVNEVLLHECWEPGGTIVFADATPDLPIMYEDGEDTACADALMNFDLNPPEVAVPQTDPAIPAAHPDEER